MEDERIWGSEEGLWLGDAEHYREYVDDECLMVVPTPPHVFGGREAQEAVAATPRWAKVELDQRKVSRPQEGLIVIAYRARAERDGIDPYEAFCTSTYRRLSAGEWRVVQHQQTPKMPVGG